MTLDVVFSPRELIAGELADRTVIVIDVLRATSTICAALSNGARAIVPATDAAEATRLAELLGDDDVLLAGERNSVKIPGFMLGNSPAEMTAARVRGKLVITTTTNGTGALLATAGARDVVIAAAVNLTVAGEFARRTLDTDGDLVILCAGREHGFGLDDAYIAGCLAMQAVGSVRRRKGVNDAGLVVLDLARRYRDRVERVLMLSHAGRDLVDRGFRADVHDAATVDAHPVLPRYHERRLTISPSIARRI